MSWASKHGCEALAGFATQEERDLEEHFSRFLEGEICDCLACQEWKEQERRDLEDV